MYQRRLPCENRWGRAGPIISQDKMLILGDPLYIISYNFAGPTAQGVLDPWQPSLWEGLPLPLSSAG